MKEKKDPFQGVTPEVQIVTRWTGGEQEELRLENCPHQRHLRNISETNYTPK